MKCLKCKDTGWYMYDHNHGKVCEECCPCDEGWFELKEYYGEDNGKMCCVRGCGKVITKLEAIE